MKMLAIITKKQKQGLAQVCVIRQDVYVSFDRELALVPKGGARKEHWYDCYHAPACDTVSRNTVAGSLLWDEHPKRPFSRLTAPPSEQPTEYIGVGAVVYLKDCFNFGRVAKFFGFDAPVDEVLAGRNPLGEMALHPLTITAMGRFSNFITYTLTDKSGKSITLHDGVQFEPCLPWEHEEKARRFYENQANYQQAIAAKRETEKNQKLKHEQQFIAQCTELMVNRS